MGRSDSAPLPKEALLAWARDKLSRTLDLELREFLKEVIAYLEWEVR